MYCRLASDRMTERTPSLPRRTDSLHRLERLLLPLLMGLIATPVPLHAATLHAGAGEPYPTPSAAIKAAHSGDTVKIAPGTYYDCAIVGQSNLTIAGTGPDGATVLTDRQCAGKASLVIDGNDVTIRDLTLARIRVPDGNGAGIRAEGGSLTVDRVRFINDEDGILAAMRPSSTLSVTDSVFKQDGICDPRCGYSIDADGLLILRIAHSVFTAGSGGGYIHSSAQKTVLAHDTLEDAGGPMSGPLALVNGGSIQIRNTTVVLGPKAVHRPGAVLAVGNAFALVARGNTLHEPPGMDVPLVRNWTGVDAVTEANHVPAGEQAVSTAGSTYHRLRARLAALRDSLHADASLLRHLVAVVVHRFM